MNVLSIGPAAHHPFPFRQIIDICVLGAIKEARNQGFAVHVAVEAQGPSPPHPDTITDETIEQYTERVIKWAEICEDYGVEYFSPLNEADYILHRDRAISWHAEVLPRIRGVYSGKVLARWSCYDKDDAEDISPITGGQINEAEAYVYRVRASEGFDGVMLDFPILERWQLKYYFNASKELEEGDPWRPSSLEEIVLATSQAAGELGIPIYVGEIAVAGTDPISGLTKKLGMQSEEGMAATEEEAAEYFEKSLDTIIPYYDGVVCTPWPGNRLPTQVIKEKFGELQ